MFFAKDAQLKRRRFGAPVCAGYAYLLVSANWCGMRCGCEGVVCFGLIDGVIAIRDALRHNFELAHLIGTF